jgi:hypothetical protein
VVAVTVPSNYDDAGLTISVDPNTLYQYAISDIPNHIQSLADSITKIVGVWNGLNNNNVGWVGASASEAQDFNSKWTTAVNGLFGTTAEPASGVLPKIGNAVAQASVNYGTAEDTTTTNLQHYIDGLNTPAGGGSSVNSPPTRGGNQGPVSENAPAPPNGPAPSPAAPPTPANPGSKSPFE